MVVLVGLKMEIKRNVVMCYCVIATLTVGGTKSHPSSRRWGHPGRMWIQANERQAIPELFQSALFITSGIGTFANAVYTNEEIQRRSMEDNKLSALISNLSSQLLLLGTDLDKLETDLDKLETSLSGVSSSDITQIKADVAQLKTDVAAISASSSGSPSSSTDLTALNAQVVTNTQDISTLDTKRQTNEIKINDNVSKAQQLCSAVSAIFVHFRDVIVDPMSPETFACT